MRMRKITLKENTDYGGPRKFTVMKLMESIEFSIGQELTAKEVDELACARTWTVTVQG